MPFGPDQGSVAPSAPHFDPGAHQEESGAAGRSSDGMPLAPGISLPLPNADVSTSKGEQGGVATGGPR